MSYIAISKLPISKNPSLQKENDTHIFATDAARVPGSPACSE